ncbi:MAG: single-stranded-DNA-specific exonuclease RecJ [Bdellovibrionales bacterium]
MLDSLSFNKARWDLPDVDLSYVERIARTHDVPEVAARMLAGRGVAEDEIAAFLHPTLKDHFPDPFSMAGMEAMADHVAAAIIANRKFAIFGDFDVDGATSSAVLHRFLKHCGIDAPIYIPGRLTEGYGPNIPALQKLRDAGAEVLFLLDCGTTAFDTVQAGVDMGLEIVILDHHEAETRLPAAQYTINPKRKDDASGLDMLAAVGVTFMACVAVQNKLRAAGFFAASPPQSPPQAGGRIGGEAPLMRWLDLVALGTVCDMVPLLGVNRLLVRRGFAVMQATQNVGLRQLIAVSRITGALSPYHAGFILGPRINAGSRVHQSDLGARLLSTDDAEAANQIAWTLNDCNDMRKELQAAMEREAIAQVEAQGLDQHPVIVAVSDGFHQGLSGLVAGRLKEKYGKPAVVIALEDIGGTVEGRGSGRSVAGIHIAQAFIDARNEGLIQKGGGHAMAGGFTLAGDQIEAFRDFLYAHIARQAGNQGANIVTALDAVVTVRGASPDFVRVVQDTLGPFGQGYEEPLFLFQNVRVHSADVVGDSHVRVMISDWEGGTRMKAMAFRALGTPLGDALLKQGKAAFDIVGSLKIDNWGGRDKAELHIKDARFCVAAQTQAAE